MVTSSNDGVQDPLVLVQRNVFAPTARFVTPLVGEAGVVTVAPPAITVHAPMPVVIVLPANVAVVAQTLWSGPARAVVGAAVRVIVTSSNDGVQDPLVLVQRNVFAPTARFVTPLVGEAGVVTVAPPAITVHAPVPVEIVLPANVAVVAQTL